MKVIVLNEAVDENHLYHYTNLNGLIGIIQSNKLYGNVETKGILKGKATVSFSRLGAGHTSDKLQSGTDVVKIIFDKTKLKNNYKITPYEYRNSRDNPTSARSEGKSEYEDALVLETTETSAVLKDNNGDFMAKVNFDGLCNIISVVDENANKLDGDFYYTEDTWEGYLENGYMYHVSVTYIPSDGTYHVMAEPDYDSNMDMLGSYEDDSEYEEEVEKIENLETLDTWIEVKSEKYVKNVDKCIVGIQLQKNTYDFLFNNVEDKYVEETIINTLNRKRTSGLNPNNKQRDVSHNINTVEDFKKFLKSLKFKISWYK